MKQNKQLNFGKQIKFVRFFFIKKRMNESFYLIGTGRKRKYRTS